METINVIRTFTYDVESVKESIRENNNDPGLEVSDDDVMEMVARLAYEDMRSAPSRHELIFQDEDGNDI
jgi:uncharacterized protein (DUF849 family)